MFPDLTDDQRALRAELQSYFATLISPAEREIMLTERHGPVYREVVSRMGRDGWLGVGWPAEYGGRGLGQIEQQIFVTEAALADVRRVGADHGELAVHELVDCDEAARLELDRGR